MILLRLGLTMPPTGRYWVFRNTPEEDVMTLRENTGTFPAKSFFEIVAHGLLG